MRCRWFEIPLGTARRSGADGADGADSADCDDIAHGDDGDGCADGAGASSAVVENRSVICIPDFATVAECEQLVAESIRAEERQLQNPLTSNPTRLRFMVRGGKLSNNQRAVPLDLSIQALAEALVRRAVSLVQTELPTLAAALDLIACPDNTKMAYSEGEPALNLYYGPGGDFKPHQDMQALTLLLPLSTHGLDYEGGGTLFFSHDVELSKARSGEAPPIRLLHPPAGAALLWAGTLVHAGAPVTAGRRLVLVASFTPHNS